MGFIVKIDSHSQRRGVSKRPCQLPIIYSVAKLKKKSEIESAQFQKR